MIKKIPFAPRKCAVCQLIQNGSSFAQTRSQFFTDGHLPICNSCLDKEAINLDGSWDFVNQVCQWANIPFVPDKWTAIWNTQPQIALSTYLRVMNGAEWVSIKWEDYEKKWKAAIAENREKEIHPIFNAQELDQLRHDWGTSYTPEELIKLRDLYEGIKQSFGISNPLTEQDGRQLCKLSLEIDKCIQDNGANGVDKLVTSYNKLKEGAGFTNDKATDANSFGSISELVYYLEKTGWKIKFHDSESRDIVDETIKNIQNYNSRLYRNESTIGDQIDSRLKNIQVAQSLEQQSFEDEELEQYRDQLYTPNEEEEVFEEEI